jgi:hypothetical protein
MPHVFNGFPVLRMDGKIDFSTTWKNIGTMVTESLEPVPWVGACQQTTLLSRFLDRKYNRMPLPDK